MIPAQLRTGLLAADDDGDDDDTTAKFVALLRMFTKEGVEVAARYVHACGRNEVSGDDMRKALMYSARMFFQKEEEQLRGMMEAELEEMDAEAEEESEGEEDEDEENEEDEGAEGEVVVDERDRRFAKNVDTVCALWDRWEPDDPVSALIKRSIDATTAA